MTPMASAYINEKVPDPFIDRHLKPCEQCGTAHNNILIRRQGPTVLWYGSNRYRAVCLACQHKGKPGRTPEAAIRNWNTGETHNTLRATRKAKGLSIEKLAEMAGVAETTISKTENGRSHPSRRTKRKLATALGVKVSEI